MIMLTKCICIGACLCAASASAAIALYINSFCSHNEPRDKETDAIVLPF